jgi:drug/metabolite transporter (DMT)-like permease
VKDGIIMVALALSMATLITTHVALAGRLFRRRPRWRGLAGLVVPPLAVIWALRAGWNKIAALWLGSVTVYFVVLAVART